MEWLLSCSARSAPVAYSETHTALTQCPHRDHTIPLPRRPSVSTPNNSTLYLGPLFLELPAFSVLLFHPAIRLLNYHVALVVAAMAVS